MSHRITGHVLHAYVPSGSLEDTIVALEMSFNGSLYRLPDKRREVMRGDPTCGTGCMLDEVVCVIRHDPPDEHVSEHLAMFAEQVHQRHPDTTVLVRCDLLRKGEEFAV